VNDPAVVQDDQAQRDLLGRFALECPIGGGEESRTIDVRRRRCILDEIAVRPRNRRRLILLRRRIEDRQAVDIVERLIGREHDAADT
jgi:hypothetical protein